MEVARNASEGFQGLGEIQGLSQFESLGNYSSQVGLQFLLCEKGRPTSVDKVS